MVRGLMRRLIASMCFALALSACAASASPSAPAASVGVGQPVIECLGGLTASTCDQAVKVVLDTVAPSGWTPTHLWLNSGSFGPPELLFDPNANFPAPSFPYGERSIGNAEVAFAQTDQHAAINISATGSAVVAHLVGYAVPDPDWCSGTCPTAVANDGPFKLELVLPRVDWKADEPMTGTAILSYGGPNLTEIFGSGTLIGFRYSQIDGSHRVEPVSTADCRHYEISPATPMNAPLSKSGGFSPDQPDFEFLRSFLTSPDVRLPAGTWDVSAVTQFTEGDSCGLGGHSMTATVRVTVTD